MLTWYSYAASWEAYIAGHIVSESALRYIPNLLGATAATKTEDSEDSSNGVAVLIEERFFDDGSFPSLKEMKKAQANAKHPVEEHPAPFQGKTLPSASLTTVSYGQRLANWMERLQQEEERPTSEQLAVLDRVAERVLLEFRFEKRPRPAE